MTATTTEDEPARRRIATDLDTNMLVEAGAGSGKTTSLVGRMHALVMRGEPVERIAAVTFTRKAANELRERFQLRLETELYSAQPGSVAWAHCDRALRDIDRSFLGTIHSFCSRILREHPLEIGLDPNFSEVTDDAWKELGRRFWNRWVERCRLNADSALVELAGLGVDPRSLYDGFAEVMRYQDVELPAVETVKPGGAACRVKLEALLRRAREMMPAEEPADGWDELMGLVRQLEYLQRTDDWDNIAALCSALERITKKRCGRTLKRWSDSKKIHEAVKTLSDDFLALMEGDIAALLACWYEHRYPAVMQFLQRAADHFASERHETGQLGFDDLLTLTARLLRECPRVRDGLGERYRYLLVDEFQDTDPVQAQVCFLLASKAQEGTDWRRVTPRPGAIFLVGDPKQSIYRFRRADIQVYEFAKRRMSECGAVLSLTSNFRSVTSIGEFVNRYFSSVFPDEATATQAQFTAMRAERPPALGDGVSEYWVRPENRYDKSIIAADAEQVASWIADRVASGQRSPADFLILTGKRDPIASYARALARRNIPVSTAGARLPQEAELKELLVLLHAIADPDNPIAIAAALEGLFFGCGPADLYDAHVAGLQFTITHAPNTNAIQAGAALFALHEWWKISQRHGADVLLERILDDTGLLVYAASQTLGDARAGALLRMVDTLRSASMSGASGITDAMDHIEILLARDTDDASLRPGRGGAVRVMNLHKAKGLEASVVILAAPVASKDHAASIHIVRGDDGVVTGGIVISCGRTTVAQPAEWEKMAAVEQQFAIAEEQRLLYVAATRAMSELLISRCEPPRAKSAKEDPPDTSVWSPLGAVLDQLAGETEMKLTAAPGRRVVDRDAGYIAGAITAAHDAVARASVSSTTHHTVTESEKEQRETARAYDLSQDRGRGKAWGRAVHRCIEATGIGRASESLRAFVAAVASDEGLPDRDAAELESLISEVRQSELWMRLVGDGNARFEMPVMRFTHDGERAALTEGVIDAAALTSDGWMIVDWKTDVATGDEWTRRKAQYDRQVAAYEQILSALSERPATSTIHRVRASSSDAS